MKLVLKPDDKWLILTASVVILFYTRRRESLKLTSTAIRKCNAKLGHYQIRTPFLCRSFFCLSRSRSLRRHQRLQHFPNRVRDNLVPLRIGMNPVGQI